MRGSPAPSFLYKSSSGNRYYEVMASTPNLTVVISAKDKLTKELNNIKKEIESLNQTSGDWQDKFQSQVEGMIRKVGYLDAALVSLAGVTTVALSKAFVDFGKDAVSAFTAAQEAAVKLETVVLNVEGNTMEGVKALNSQAKALEKTGVYSSDVTTALQAQLATFDLQAESIEKLTPKLLDMMVAEKGLNATQADAKAIGQMVGNVRKGNYASLLRMGFDVTEQQKRMIESGDEILQIEAIKDIIGSTYDGLNEAARKSFAGQVQAAKNAITSLKQVFGQSTVENILQPLMDKLGNIFADVDWEGLFTNDGVNGMINGLTVMFQKAFEALPEIIDSLSQYLDIFFHSLGIALSRTDPSKLIGSMLKLGATLGKAIFTLLIKGIGSLVDHQDEINAEIAAVLNACFAKLPEMLDGSIFGDILNPILKPLTDFASDHPEFIEFIAKIAEDMAGMAIVLGNVALAGGALSLIFEAISGAITFLVSPLGLVLAALTLLYIAWTEDWGGIQEKAQAVWDSLQPFFQWLGEQVQGMVTFWNENIQPWIEEIAPLVKGAIDTLVGHITSFVAINQEKINLILDGLKGAWEVIKAVVKVGWELVSGIIKTGLQILNGDWKGAWETIKETFANVWNAVWELLQTVWNEIKKYWAEALDYMINVGKNLVESLWNGISSMAGWIGDKISGFVSGIVDSFNKGFEIGSPSKIFIKMGEFNIAGLEEGMREAVNKMDMSILTSSITADFGRAMSAYTPNPAYASTGASYDNSRNSSVTFNGGVNINNGLDVEAVAQYIGATVANAIY